MHQHITINGKQVHYRLSGEGPCIILLHGFLESLEMWNDLLPHLQNQFTVLSIDLPGHGRSENHGDVHTMDLMADIIHALAFHLKIGSFLVIGHSMGGYVGLKMASVQPDLMKGLILLHSHAADDSDESRLQRDRTIRAVKADHTGFIYSFIPSLFAEMNRERLANDIENMANRAAGTSKKAIVAALEGMKQRPDHLDFLAKSSIPVLFIAGKSDARIPFDMIVEQARHTRSAELLALEKTGHMGFLECPEEVFPAILSFCKRKLRQ